MRLRPFLFAVLRPDRTRDRDAIFGQPIDAPALRIAREWAAARGLTVTLVVDEEAALTVCACGAPLIQPARGRRRRWCSDRSRKVAERALSCPGVQLLSDPWQEPERARRGAPSDGVRDVR